MLVRPQGLLCLIERADPIVVRFAARPVRKLTPSALPAAPPVTFAERVPCVATVSAALDGGQHRLSMNLSPSSDELGSRILSAPCDTCPITLEPPTTRGCARTILLEPVRRAGTGG